MIEKVPVLSPRYSNLSIPFLLLPPSLLAVPHPLWSGILTIKTGTLCRGLPSVAYLFFHLSWHFILPCSLYGPTCGERVVGSAVRWLWLWVGCLLRRSMPCRLLCGGARRFSFSWWLPLPWPLGRQYHCHPLIEGVPSGEVCPRLGRLEYCCGGEFHRSR